MQIADPHTAVCAFQYAAIKKCHPEAVGLNHVIRPEFQLGIVYSSLVPRPLPQAGKGLVTFDRFSWSNNVSDCRIQVFRERAAFLQCNYA